MSEAVNHPPLDPASHIAELDRISQAVNAGLDVHQQRIDDELDAALRDIHATTTPNIQEPETTPIHSEREEANMANAFGQLNAEVVAPIDHSKPLDRTMADAAARNARKEFLAKNRAASLGSTLAPEAGVDESGKQYGPDLFTAAAEDAGEQARQDQLDLEADARAEADARTQADAARESLRKAEYEAEVAEELRQIEAGRQQRRIDAFAHALEEGPQGRRDAKAMLDVMLAEADANGDWTAFDEAYNLLDETDRIEYSKTPKAQSVMEEDEADAAWRDARRAEREAQKAAAQAVEPATRRTARADDLDVPEFMQPADNGNPPARPPRRPDGSRPSPHPRPENVRDTQAYADARGTFDAMTSDQIDQMTPEEIRRLTRAERAARTDAYHDKVWGEVPSDFVPAPANRFAGLSREELDGIDPTTMTTADRDAYFAAYRATSEVAETRRPAPLGPEAAREPESRGRRLLRRVGAVAVVALAATLGTTLTASITGEHPNKPGNAAPSVSAAKSASPLELALPSSSPAPSASASKAPGQQGGGAQQGAGNVGNGQPGGSPGEQTPGTPAGPKVHELAPGDTIWDFVKREMGIGDVPDYLLTDEQASKLRDVANGIVKDNRIPDQGRFMHDYQPFSYRPFEEYIKTVS